jgi:2-polyprenyl-3-methyl-5-hydroxy-6-metoxy-1,4-benzoquinol methylase
VNRRAETIPASYFDALYTENPDPWNFASSPYERQKYDATLAALPRDLYEHAFEVGCSIGILTRRLAHRCRRLLAVDASETPLREARRICADRPNVTFEHRFIPQEWPDETFDLIVLSEVIYYLTAPLVAAAATRVCASLAPQGDIVLVHWIGETDYPLSGDEATEQFIASARPHARLVGQQRTSRHRLDVLRGS